MTFEFKKHKIIKRDKSPKGVQLPSIGYSGNAGKGSPSNKSRHGNLKFESVGVSLPTVDQKRKNEKLAIFLTMGSAESKTRESAHSEQLFRSLDIKTTKS